MTSERDMEECITAAGSAGLSVVLEHHGGVELDGRVGGGARWWRRLASENWDAPLVVTPAHAGVIRRMSPDAGLSMSAPRTCGGDPFIALSNNVVLLPAAR